jgi:hypothetical protein
VLLFSLFLKTLFPKPHPIDVVGKELCRMSERKYVRSIFADPWCSKLDGEKCVAHYISTSKGFGVVFLKDGECLLFNVEDKFPEIVKMTAKDASQWFESNIKLVEQRGHYKRYQNIIAATRPELRD